MDYLGHTPSSSSTNYIGDDKEYCLVTYQPKTSTFIRRAIPPEVSGKWICGLWASETDVYTVNESSDFNVVYDRSSATLTVRPPKGTYHVTFRADYAAAYSLSVGLCRYNLTPIEPLTSTEVRVDSVGIRRTVFCETIIPCNGNTDTLTIILKTTDTTCDLWNYSFAIIQV